MEEKLKTHAKFGRKPVYGETRTITRKISMTPEQFALLRAAGLASAVEMLEALLAEAQKRAPVVEGQ